MDWKEQLIIDWNSRLKIKDNKVIFKGYEDYNNVVIPSQMFPLSKSTPNYNIFCHYNTVDFEDKELEKRIGNIVDAMDVKVGHCYQNSKKLHDELVKDGINAQTYVGWLFVGKDTFPICHAFVVIDNNKVLDLGVIFNTTDFESMNKKQFETPDEMRLFMAKEHINRLKLPYHEICGFGQVDKSYTYVAVDCDPDIGREIFVKLRAAYPNHIAYKNRGNINGLSRLQEMIIEMQG